MRNTAALPTASNMLVHCMGSDEVLLKEQKGATTCCCWDTGGTLTAHHGLQVTSEREAGAVGNEHRKVDGGSQHGLHT